MHQDDDGQRWLRTLVDFTAGRESGGLSGAVATVVIRDTRPMHRLVATGELTPEMILEWRGHDLDAETEAFIDEVARLSAAVSEARHAVSRHEAAQERLEAEQARIRSLLDSVPGPSEAHDQLLADLLALEDRTDIVATAGEVEATLSAQHAAEDAFATFLAGS